MKRIKIIMLLLFSIICSPIYAKIFNNQHINEAFGSHQNYKEIKKLNKSLGPFAFHMCSPNFTQEKCLDGVNGKPYVVVHGTYEVFKVNYVFDSFLGRRVARSYKDKSTTERVFFEHLQQQWLQLTNQLSSESHNLKPRSNEVLAVENFATTSNGPFSGICGPESDPLLASWIPDEPFQDACEGHDRCYTTYTARSQCDSLFLDRMRNRIDELTDWQDNWIPDNFDPEFYAYITLSAMANMYYNVVLLVGDKPYCESKDDKEYCLAIDGEYPPPGNGISGPWGTGTGQPPGSGSGPGYSDPGSGEGEPSVLGGCKIRVYWQVCTSGGCNDYTTEEDC